MKIQLVLFGLLLLVLGICLPVALAQEANPSSGGLPSPSPVDYVLPYPGLLPDNPLYPIKLFRDKILLLFITNPARKVEFYILMSDKRLHMSKLLFEKNNVLLAADTVEGGVEYLSQAEELLFSSPIDSLLMNGIKDKLEKSLLKHEELVTSFMTKTSGADSQKYKIILDELYRIHDAFRQKK